MILHVIWGNFLELLAVLLCLILYPFRSSKIQKGNAPQILCVHGYLHNETGWVFYRHYLKKVATLNTLYYSSLFRDIPTNSVKIKERVEQIAKSTGKEVQILIGHSLGGLVCLEYALEHAPKDKTIWIVTLGSPLHGTKMAYFGLGPSAKEMRPHSSYLQHLHERLAKSTHIKVLCFESAIDLITVPSSSALLPEYPFATNVRVASIGHVSLLFSKKVILTICSHLFNGLNAKNV